MTRSPARLFLSLGLSWGCLTAIPAESAEHTFWQWASTPPMGWNSYDSFGDSVTEAEVRANTAAPDIGRTPM